MPLTAAFAKGYGEPGNPHPPTQSYGGTGRAQRKTKTAFN